MKWSVSSGPFSNWSTANSVVSLFSKSVLRSCEMSMIYMSPQSRIQRSWQHNGAMICCEMFLISTKPGTNLTSIIMLLEQTVAMASPLPTETLYFYIVLVYLFVTVFYNKKKEAIMGFVILEQGVVTVYDCLFSPASQCGRSGVCRRILIVNDLPSFHMQTYCHE